jgi:hypothetical protein
MNVWRKIILLFVTFSVLLTSFSPLGTGVYINSTIQKVTSNEDGGTFETERRWDIHDITIVYLNGSFYEMGYQLGSLIKEEFTINKRAFLNFYQREGILYSDLISLWNKQGEFVSDETIDYIQGTADALGISFYDVACIWIAEGASYSRCSSFAAWGQATKDGELIHMRSLEFPLTIKDPVSNEYVQNSPLIVIADPEGDQYNAFLYPTFAGYVVEDGINEKGIAVSNMWSPNSDQTENGAPMGVRLFESLYKADTAEEAIQIITSDRTFGYNFIVSDAKKPMGYAVETTASLSYAGTWDNPTESHKPFWAIRDVVRRTNCFLNPTLAETQREYYNPNHILYWLSSFSEHPDPWTVIWNHFKALSKGIESQWGKLDINSSTYMVRQVYHGGYDPIWNLMLLRAEWTTWWQWVACPATGEFKIAFANGDMSAHYNTVFSFNFLETIRNHKPI